MALTNQQIYNLHIYNACAGGRLAELKDLLKNSAQIRGSINDPVLAVELDSEGNHEVLDHPAFMAIENCKNGNTDILKALINSPEGVDFDIKDREDGVNLATFAIYLGQIECLDLIVRSMKEKGKQSLLDNFNTDGGTALGKAVSKIVSRSIIDESTWASVNQQVDLIKWYRGEKQIPEDLHLECTYSGNFHAVELLLQAGASINRRSLLNTRTPLEEIELPIEQVINTRDAEGKIAKIIKINSRDSMTLENFKIAAADDESALVIHRLTIDLSKIRSVIEAKHQAELDEKKKLADAEQLRREMEAKHSHVKQELATHSNALVWVGNEVTSVRHNALMQEHVLKYQADQLAQLNALELNKVGKAIQAFEATPIFKASLGLKPFKQAVQMSLLGDLTAILVVASGRVQRENTRTVLGKIQAVIGVMGNLVPVFGSLGTVVSTVLSKADEHLEGREYERAMTLLGKAGGNATLLSQDIALLLTEQYKDRIAILKEKDASDLGKKLAGIILVTMLSGEIKDHTQENSLQVQTVKMLGQHTKIEKLLPKPSIPPRPQTVMVHNQGPAAFIPQNTVYAPGADAQPMPMYQYGQYTQAQASNQYAYDEKSNSPPKSVTVATATKKSLFDRVFH